MFTAPSGDYEHGGRRNAGRVGSDRTGTAEETRSSAARQTGVRPFRFSVGSNASDK